MLSGLLTHFVPLPLVISAFLIGSPSSRTPSAPASAAARHTKLLRSTPASGAVVATPPATITLAFSKPVQARLTRVQLTDPSGASVAVEQPRTTDGGDTVVVAAIKGGMTGGLFTVNWATTSRDSHVIKGSFRFTFRTSSAGGGAAS